jgi:uncharacterized protein YdeI (YjbR/CyaY-like superfamily)
MRRMPKPELPIHQSRSREHWERWLQSNHSSSAGVRLKLAKQGSPVATVSFADALELALCFGWIDSQRLGYDEHFYLQRFTPRGPRSKWSQINRDKAIRLIERGQMRAAGHAQIRAAQADGRWDAAYEPQSQATIPPDLQTALDQNPTAARFFATLTGSTRYAFLFRLHHVKTETARAKRITDYITRLTNHRTLDDRS